MSQNHCLSEPHVMSTYGRVNIALERGQGVRLWDTEGREYLDGLSGIAVNTLGHNHPKLIPALQQQLSELIHTCNYYFVPGQEALAARLAGLSGLNKVFFCNSGLEANEAAIKLARKRGNERGYRLPRIVVCDHAFHGRSLATLSASANPKIQEGFEPLVPGFIRAPFNDFEGFKKAVEGQDEIAAVFFEVIQGEGGIHPARMDFLRQVQAFCEQQDWLLMLDEVQCGMGRSGKWFAYQWGDIKPDVVTMAKGLASGIPVGAVLAGPKAADLFQKGNHGTTFGGNPLAMRAGLETIRILEEDRLLENAGSVGEFLQQRLREGLAGLPGFVQVRGQGLMIGVEFDRPCGALIQQAADAGLLVSVTAECVLRLLPALIMTQAEAQELVERLLPVLQRFFLEQKAT